MLRLAIVAALLAFAASLSPAAAASVSSSSTYETKERLRGSTTEHHADRELIILDGSVRGCIELQNGKTASGSKLVFGTCKRRINGFDERDVSGTTDLVQLYSRKNTTMCMQADPLKEGTYLRLRPCNASNKYQRFEWYGQIKPAADKSLCVAYHGVHANVGDYIKLKKCSRFPDGWSRD